MKRICLLLGFLSLVAGRVWALDATLNWDEHPAPDLAGFKVYYGPQSGNYSGNEAVEGVSPIWYSLSGVTGHPIVNTQPVEASLTNLSDTEKTYFVVTAYDTEGMESGYSNEVFVDPSGATLPPEPDTTPPAIPVNPWVTVSDVPFSFSISGLPVDMFDSGFPQSQAITLNIPSLPPIGIKLTMTVVDADFADEGRLFVNGTQVAQLFDPPLEDATTQIKTILIPVGRIKAGDNTLTFFHDNTQGYQITDIQVQAQ